jgi:hypothetical protein
LLSTGFERIAENTAACSPAAFSEPNAICVVDRLDSPGSVTKSGRYMPFALQASASSAMRPAPNRTLVG